MLTVYSSMTGVLFPLTSPLVLFTWHRYLSGSLLSPGLISFKFVFVSVKLYDVFYYHVALIGLIWYFIWLYIYIIIIMYAPISVIRAVVNNKSSDL